MASDSPPGECVAPKVHVFGTTVTNSHNSGHDGVWGSSRGRGTRGGGLSRVSSRGSHSTSIAPPTPGGLFGAPSQGSHRASPAPSSRQVHTPTAVETFGGNLPSTSSIFSTPPFATSGNTMSIKQEEMFKNLNPLPTSVTPKSVAVSQSQVGTSSTNNIFQPQAAFPTTNTVFQPRGSVPTAPKTNSREKKKLILPKFRAGEECVTFLVGMEEKKFLVHKAFAIHYSTALKTAFEDPAFLESETQIYRLKYTTEGAFILLVQWLYTQKIECNEEEETATFAKLWLLAKDLLIRPLQNDAIDHLEKLRLARGEGIPASELAFIYANTADDSPLRKYVVDDYVMNIDAEFLTKSSEDIPKAMLLGIAVFYKTNMVQLRLNKVFGLTSQAKVMDHFHVEEQ